MDELTIMFMAGAVIVYMIQILAYKKNTIELPAFTLILGMCATAAILTDESINGDMVGLTTLFPIVFIIIHSVIHIIWRR